MRDNVIILPDQIVEKTEGGLFLPDAVQKRQDTGIVLAVGPLVKELKVGDRVMHGEFCGQSYSQREIIDGKEMFIMKERDVIAKIEEEKP